MNIKYIKYRLIAMVALCIASALQLNHACAQDAEKADNDGGEVITTLKPHSKDGIFDENASYTFNVKNTYKTNQEGQVSYMVTTPYGKPVLKDSVEVKLSKNSSESYEFNIPKLGTGIYKISFMINVSDYDDTTKRVFAIRPDEITSKHPRPADFDNFWDETKRELAAVPPNYKLTEHPELAKGKDKNHKCYLVEMKSLDNLTVRAWLTIPATNIKNKKFAVLVGLPGYQVALQPMFSSDDDLAMISLNVRGQGNSRDVVHTKRADFITLNIEDKNRYIMRGVIMDCVRMIDFIYSRNDLDHDRIQVSGGSMGGFLTVALAGLDNRVKLFSAQNPILSDVRSQVGEVEWPITDMQKYAKDKPGVSFEQVLNNMDYYDLKNFAPNIQSKIMMGIGLLDHLAPPNTEFVLYNTISPKYRDIMVFKDLGHEVAKEYQNKDGSRMRDVFAMF